jgi:fucose permease
MIMAALAIFQAWFWVGFGIGKFLFVYVLKTFSPQKLRVVGACLHLADCPFNCVTIRD